MQQTDLFSKGFPTNRIPVTIPSTGQDIVLRETTVIELKSMAKTVIDNLGRRQMNVIYDAATEYLQSMILTDGVDLKSLTEFDRLYMMMVFFQMSFYKDPITYQCPHCGVEIVYRYDIVRYIQKMGEPEVYVEDQVVRSPCKNRLYEMTIGWPTVATMSKLMNHFYNNLGQVTEEMERTQYGINFVLAFMKKVSVFNIMDDNRLEATIELEQIDEWGDRMDCINALPSMVVFDEKSGIFSQITGYFINRLENCFGSETCPQCHKETNYGLPQSSLFNSFFYGSLQSIYAFLMKVECLMVFRYGCCIFDKEPYMTYNDLNTLIHQIGVTMEKENEERKKMNRDNFTKGLWYIREILNTMIFPQDKQK